MTTDYNPIAEQYQRSKQQPWRTFLECSTLLELVGDPQGKAVLDVACGEGFYTRLLRERGASSVTGIDLSQGMIDLARQQEAQHQLGIHYLVGDAREMPAEEAFDLVVAAYLLNYARTADELQEMCAGLARSLKPGGRFVTVNCNPACNFVKSPSYRPYGFETTIQEPVSEGAAIEWKFFLETGEFSIENYYLSVSTHETALRQAGFSTVHWHAPRLSREGLAAYDMPYWSSFLAAPPIAFIECVK